MSAAIVSQPPPIIELPPEPVVRELIVEVPIVPKELSVEEKIKTNYYKCTEAQYIRADNAKCKDKPVPKPAPKPVMRVVSTDNLYEYGQCTYGVKMWKPSVSNHWGHANNWGYAAQADGWTVSSVPVVGAVAWTTRGYYGHVGLVTDVRPGQVLLLEMNYDWNGGVRETWTSTSSYQYIY